MRSLAAAQTVPKRGDVSANLAQHLQLLALAADAGAQVLVFPELSLTGYELDLARELAFSEFDPRLGPLRDAAARCNLIVIVGAPVHLDSRLHIGAFLVYPDRQLGLYTKPFLGVFPKEWSPDGIVPPHERSVFELGDRDPLVEFGGNTAAVAVCAAALQPSQAQAAAERGAQSYLTGHFSIPQDVEWRASVLASYAKRHALAVVFANYGGPTGGLAAAGRSAIWSQQGECLARLEATGAGVVVGNETDSGWSVSSVMLSGDRPVL